MKLTIVMSMGGKELRLEAVTLKELLQITAWTGYKNKSEWVQALNFGEPLALQAAYALATWRDSKSKPKLDELDFDTDDMDSRLVDETDQTVEAVFELNEDGTLKIGADGRPVVTLDSDGEPQFRYSESGDLIRPTSAPATISSTRRSSRKSS